MTVDPLHADTYAVTVNGQPVAVYGAKSCRKPWPFGIGKAGEPGVKLARPTAKQGPYLRGEAGNAPYAFASFPVPAAGTGAAVVVKVRSSLPLDQVKVRPASAATVREVRGDTLVLEFDRPAKVSVEPCGRHGGLLLFADPPETDVPDAGDPKVRYFGPGVHRAGVIRLGDGETLYLAAGAIVEGGVCIQNARNVRILGRGILCGDPWLWRAGPQPHMNMFTESRGILVEGITVRCSWQWTFKMLGCRDVTFRNVNLCCGKNLNDDGIDPSSCQDVLIEDCFLRTHDDTVSIKAHCDDRRPCQNIEIRNCLHWSDLSRVLMVGPESYADRIGGIHMHDCELLWLGPNIRKCGWADWDGCAPAFCFEAAEDCTMADIVLENIVVHLDEDRDGKDLIKIEPLLTPWVRRDTLGRLANLTFRNIECVGPYQPRICVWGKDAEHDVRNVRFENVTIAGRRVGADYAGLSVNEYARGIEFA